MYNQLISWHNLLLAYRKAAKGKRGHSNVARFEYRLEDNLLRLQQELQDQTYEPGPYTHFHIHEPKRRLISAAPFRDRVVHRYVDDFLLFSNSKSELHDWHNHVIHRVSKLKLRLHNPRHPSPVTEGIPFLGFIIFPERICLKRRKGLYYQRKLKRMLNGLATPEAIRDSVRAG